MLHSMCFGGMAQASGSGMLYNGKKGRHSANRIQLVAVSGCIC